MRSAQEWQIGGWLIVPVDQGDGGGGGGRLTDLLTRDLDTGFSEVVRTHQNVVYTSLLRACGDPADAEDLAAEAFLRAYRALSTYDRERIEGLFLRPWLITIALNVWRNLIRERSRRPRQVPLEQAPERAADGDQFERLVGRTDDQRALVRLISDLPEQQRVAVVLRHVCGLSVAEVATAISAPEGTVRSLVSRGLSKLRQRAAEAPQEPACSPAGSARSPERLGETVVPRPDGGAR